MYRTAMASSLVEARRRRILEGPVAPVLFSLSWPLTIGLFAIIAINVTDTFYIGRLGGEQLAAFGYCLPVIFGMSAVSIGIGNGAAAVVARAIGAGDEERARMLTTNTILLVLIASFAITATMLAISEAVFLRFLNMPAGLLPFVNAYMDVWYPSLPLLIAPIVVNGLVRAAGEPIVPSALMVLAAVINAAVSPILVFGLLGAPEIGMAGAAWATVLARAVITAVGVYYLVSRDLMRLSMVTLKGFFSCVRDVMSYGGPAFIAQLFSPIAGAIITRLLSAEGPEAVAAFAVGARLESLAVIPFFALQSGLAPFIGQNVGARRFGRLRSAEASLVTFSLLWGAAIGLVLFCFGGSLGGLFTEDAAIRALTDRYLELLAFGLWGAGFLIGGIGALNPLGYPNLAMANNGLRFAVLYAGLAALAASGALPFFSGLTGIFLAAPLSYALSGLVSLTLVHLLLERPRRMGVEQPATAPAAGARRPS